MGSEVVVGQPEKLMAASEERSSLRLFLIEREHPRQVHFLLVPVTVPVYEYDLDGRLEVLRGHIEGEFKGNLAHRRTPQQSGGRFIRLPNHVLVNRLNNPLTKLQDKVRPVALVLPVEPTNANNSATPDLHENMEKPIRLNLVHLEFTHLLVSGSSLSGDSLPVIEESGVLADAVSCHRACEFDALTLEALFEELIYRLVAAALLDCCLDLRRRQGRPSGV
jgi:hypothetical protein